MDSAELLNDPAVHAMLEETEESKKVARLGGRKHYAVFVRLDVDTEVEAHPVLNALFEKEEEDITGNEDKDEEESHPQKKIKN